MFPPYWSPTLPLRTKRPPYFKSRAKNLLTLEGQYYCSPVILAVLYLEFINILIFVLVIENADHS